MPEDGNRTEPSEIGKLSDNHDRGPPASDPQVLQENDAHVAVALMASSIFQTFENNYDFALQNVAQQQVDSRLHGSKEIAAHLRLLKTRDARRILEIVWKETGSVSEAALRTANKLKSFKHGKLNSNSLAKALCAESTIDYDRATSIKMLVTRVVTSAEFFNLIEKAAPDGKAIPLQATASLDALMVTCHAGNGLEIHSLLGATAAGGGK